MRFRVESKIASVNVIQLVCCLLLLLGMAQISIASPPLVVPEQGPSGDVIDVMEKVCDWQISQPGYDGSQGWINGDLFAGITATYETTKEARHLEAARAWAEKFNWQLGSRTRHADDHACAQTYLDLYMLDQQDPVRYADAKTTFDYIIDNPVTFACNSNSKDFWQWCDALFMAPPVLPRLSYITGDSKYIDLMHEMWADTQGCLYDTEEHLFYRDWKYFGNRVGGEKVFWGRGNGWVIGGIVRVLQFLPHDDPLRSRYVTLLQEMCGKLATLQGEDGFWRSNLLYPAQYPNPETSGTSFFCYGIAWGVNQGILDAATFGPVIENAWQGLVANAVHDNGKLGWVQPVGAGPAASTYDTTQLYGVGAFLLAGSEMYKYYNREHLDIVEDFEVYDVDDVTRHIGAIWKDGSTNGTGSRVALGGIANQFMVIGYDNSVSPYYSEAQLEFTGVFDFSEKAILTLYCKGDNDNVTDTLYVKLKDQTGSVSVQRVDEVTLVTQAGWTELNFDLSEFTDVNLSLITQLAIGLGSESPAEPGTGSGEILIDEIMLRSSLCLSPEQFAADFNDDCDVDIHDLAIFALDWLVQYDELIVAAEPDESRLKAHYAFDETVGTASVDSTDNNYDGTAYNTSWRPDAGKYGGAILIDGAVHADSRVEIPTDSLSLSSSTVCMWVWLKPEQNPSTRFFFGHTSLPVWQNRIQVYMDGSNTLLDVGMGDTHTLNTGVASLSTEAWHHIALGWDGTDCYVYVDGQLVSSGPYSGLTSLQSLVYIGNNGNPGTAQAFNGLIDDVRIYDYRLLLEEVMWLAEAMQTEVANPKSMDLTKDGQINIEDLAVFSESWLQTSRWPVQR